MTNHSEEEYLYHYTSAAGLLGILSTRSIWATDSEYLNDGADCKTINNHLRTYLNEGTFRRAFPGTSRQQLALEAHLRRGRRTFVASFSRTPSSLTQFRMYAPDDGGFVVGFPRSFLGKAAKLVDVHYDDEEQAVWCRSFIDEFCRALDSTDDEETDMLQWADKADASGLLLEERIKRGIQCKSSEFAQEQEVRLVRHVGSIKLRASRKGNVLLPYVELPLPNESVNVRVAAGPGQYQNSIARRGLFELDAYLRESLGKWKIAIFSTGESSHRNGF